MISDDVSSKIQQACLVFMPDDHVFVFLGIPLKGKAEPGDTLTTLLTNTPPDKLKEMASVLRKIANNYDPQS